MKALVSLVLVAWSSHALARSRTLPTCPVLQRAPQVASIPELARWKSVLLTQKGGGVFELTGHNELGQAMSVDRLRQLRIESGANGLTAYASPKFVVGATIEGAATRLEIYANSETPSERKLLLVAKCGI